MTQDPNRRSSCIARRAFEQEARPAVYTQAAVEESVTEDKFTSLKPHEREAKQIHVETMIVETIRKDDKVPEQLNSQKIKTNTLSVSKSTALYIKNCLPMNIFLVLRD